jgi:hypothetical protein
MDRLQGLAEVIIAKQRHGPIGTVRLSFNSDTTRFGNLARDHYFHQHAQSAATNRLFARRAFDAGDRSRPRCRTR